ncbi:MAG: hypothetical protein ABI999_17250 [Acidobacteriota bacterium]
MEMRLDVCAMDGYRRVSRKRPCLICGKPDWCSTIADETISFCARSVLNADRISKNGWGVYYNQISDLPFKRTSFGTPKNRKRSISNILSPSKTRDEVYQKLIELSPAALSHEIVYGRGGLRERNIDSYSQYGSLPRTVGGRTELVEKLVERLSKITTFEGIPGFWRNKCGRLRLWKLFDFEDGMMLIPFVDAAGLIQACQIRFTRCVRNRSGKYVWLSSAKQLLGSSPGSPLHHAGPGTHLNQPVLVTEGALKAKTAQDLLPAKYVVANSGVATSHRQIVETARKRPLEIAFDNDSFTNPNVARALANLVGLRRLDQKKFEYADDTRVITWERTTKGIDEALMAGLCLSYLTVREWMQSLTPQCLEQANLQLSMLSGKGAAGSPQHGPIKRTIASLSRSR